MNDLDWEDRERVLRLLFSKMNAGVTPNIQGVPSKDNGARIRQDNIESIMEN